MRFELSGYAGAHAQNRFHIWNWNFTKRVYNYIASNLLRGNFTIPMQFYTTSVTLFTVLAKSLYLRCEEPFFFGPFRSRNPPLYRLRAELAERPVHPVFTRTPPLFLFLWILSNWGDRVGLAPNKNCFATFCEKPFVLRPWKLLVEAWCRRGAVHENKV